ncbi:SpoIID/LytB domain-containing protein [Calothrix sp. NIES-3974]|uniref:SpoIID/LytB domain-containing protein n=1 Tax=Calothrix sp. NIES-3974 TaxID=2005462 RepID=UPI000B5DDAF4|nr:SpoIID/LytB domain-containing protein [Calothrix sp. NIES-3974]BAZ07166.1 SpoIID/LytB domain-containing protein [Calothrix sp. NIES-3974]
MKLIRNGQVILTGISTLMLTAASEPIIKRADANQDMELKIGIVQRFGDDTKEILELAPTKDDRLRLTFPVANGNKTLETANPVRLEIAMQPIPEPRLEERVVLGTYRTFETAEHSAKAWQKKGIEVEIAQPERWEVWAKRDIYHTPLLRRFLLDSAKANGNKTAYIKTAMVKATPVASWVYNNQRYGFKNLTIESGKNLIRVNQGVKKDDTPLENTEIPNLLKPEKAKLFPGKLQIQPNAYGSYTLVNHVPLETYLRGVVPYEIGTSSPDAALEAQAIIARTYALRNLRRFAIDDYQLCADTHCQVYFGLQGVAKSTDAAIARTRGMVLTYQNELVDALYSASTGGVTAAFSDVWNGEDRPYLRPVLDAPSNVWNLTSQPLTLEENFQKFITQKTGFNESSSSLFRWRRETNIEDITKGLQRFLRVKNSPYAKFKTVKSMEVVERAPSGRILKMDIDTDIGKFSLKKDEVRSAFLAPISAFYYLQPLNKGTPGLWGYAFVGGGMGHGVGLSQIGAQNLAKQGWSSERILQFYYPGTQVQLLNNSIKFE